MKNMSITTKLIMNKCMTFDCCNVKDDIPVRSSNDLNIVRYSNNSNLINDIEKNYKSYVNGAIKCTPQEGAIIINNYNSRRKLYNMFVSTNS